MIFDLSGPHDNENVMKAENDKQIKYHDFAREVVEMWDVESAIIVPIVVSATGLTAKSLEQHLGRLIHKTFHSTYSLTRIVRT